MVRSEARIAQKAHTAALSNTKPLAFVMHKTSSS